MKLPSLTTLRRSAAEAPLPAALAGVLFAALVFQLALPAQVDLPDTALRPLKAPQLATISAAPVTVPAPLAQRDIFAPDGAGGETDASGGATLLGVARSARGGAAVLSVGGATQAVPLGGRVGNWRVTGISANAVRLDDGGRTVILRIGQSTQPAATPTEGSVE